MSFLLLSGTDRLVISGTDLLLIDSTSGVADVPADVMVGYGRRVITAGSLSAVADVEIEVGV